MKQKISHILILLNLFSTFESFEKTILFLKLNHIRINQFIDWNKTYSLAIELRLLKESNNQIKITTIARTFLAMRGDFDKLSHEQKIFIFKNCIVENNFFKSINSFLKLFSINKKELLELYKTELDFKKMSLSLEDKLILNELDVYSYNNGKFVINEPYSEILFNDKLFGNNSLSQYELDRILEEQKKIGDRGEKLTLQFEQKQFKNKKWKYAEKNVRIIGKKNVRAGYDVESFLTVDSILDSFGNGDKHIEVKSRKYNEFSFILSANELKIGKILSDRKNEEYLIYFWNNLGTKPYPTKPTKIIPFKKLKITHCENCLNYLIQV